MSPESTDPTARRPALSALEDEWLSGWDPTPGIVSVWATSDGRAVVWRRLAGTGALVREDERFRPWVLLDQLDDLRHLRLRFVVAASQDRPGRRRSSFNEWDARSSRKSDSSP